MELNINGHSCDEKKDLDKEIFPWDDFKIHDIKGHIKKILSWLKESPKYESFLMILDFSVLMVQN